MTSLVVHIVHRFDYGGLENGIVNLINGLPTERWRHAVIALAGSSGFRERILRDGVECYDCGKRSGQDPRALYRVYSLLHSLRPAIVHTRNIGTLECVVLAWAAGVRCRIHGEHGWDVHDPEGTRRTHRVMRRAIGTLATSVVAVSRQIESWLVDRVGLPARKVIRICNGVDAVRFRPMDRDLARQGLPESLRQTTFLVGSVTRFSEIKDPMNLAEAFVLLCARAAASGLRPGLVMVGDGPLRKVVASRLHHAGLMDRCWLPGSRDDIPQLLNTMDVFALGSQREGISNTVLEAMACGVPVVVTATGGNPELVEDGLTGLLVPVADPAALAAAILGYALDHFGRHRAGTAARQRIERQFSLQRMLESYTQLYERSLFGHGNGR